MQQEKKPTENATEPLITISIPKEVKANYQCKAEGYGKVASFPAKDLVECCGVIESGDGYRRECKIFKREK